MKIAVARKGLPRRWSLTTAICVAVFLTSATTAVAEGDHLKGYKIKDLNQVAPTNPVTVDNQFGSESCTLKKPQLFLVQSEKNNGDDPRGGPAGNFVCYKAKCTGSVPPVTDADGQFGLHKLQTVKAKLLCLPVDTQSCGDNELDGTEQCDGTSDTACPGLCEADCTCGPAPCQATLGGFCWFWGGYGESCDTVCSNNGRSYDSATLTYAGSDGTDANCQALDAALGMDGDFTTAAVCELGVGCATVAPVGVLRCSGPTTSSEMSVGAARACACQ